MYEAQNSPKVEWNEDSIQQLRGELEEIREAIALLYYQQGATLNDELARRLLNLVKRFENV
jgi:hypothetical protein